MYLYTQLYCLMTFYHHHCVRFFSLMTMSIWLKGRIFFSLLQFIFNAWAFHFCFFSSGSLVCLNGFVVFQIFWSPLPQIWIELLCLSIMCLQIIFFLYLTAIWMENKTITIMKENDTHWFYLILLINSSNK